MIKHETSRFDQLHSRLLSLLDIIETQGDSSLARRRFNIMEEFGYETVEVATLDTTVVPFKPRKI